MGLWDCITNDFRVEKHRPFGESECNWTGPRRPPRVSSRPRGTARDDRVDAREASAAKSYLSSRLAQIRIAGMGHGQGEPGVTDSTTDCVSVFLSPSNLCFMILAAKHVELVCSMIDHGSGTSTPNVQFRRKVCLLSHRTVPNEANVQFSTPPGTVGGKY